MLDAKTQKKTQGFSMIELMLVVAVILVLTAITVPHIIDTVSDISLRYAATDLSGLLQSARIQAVRKNTSYTIQQGALLSGTQGYYVDIAKTGVDATGDPAMPLTQNMTVHAGIGSGAPGEGAFIAGLNYTVNPAGDPVSFNARGLPCIAAGAACPQTPGQGFVIFLSKPTLTGNTPWACLVITPSGHTQIWTTGTNAVWVLRD
jgi:prepilin-type N-terminal cleavage/methylation domain-containing protein